MNIGTITDKATKQAAGKNIIEIEIDGMNKFSVWETFPSGKTNFTFKSLQPLKTGDPVEFETDDSGKYLNKIGKLKNGSPAAAAVIHTSGVALSQNASQRKTEDPDRQFSIENQVLLQEAVKLIASSGKKYETATEVAKIVTDIWHEIIRYRRVWKAEQDVPSETVAENA